MPSPLPRALLLVPLPACLLPPAAIGLRSPGDVASEGTVIAGGGVAGVSSGLSAATADVEVSLSDQVAVGGGLGWSTGALGSAQVRWSTVEADGPGFGVVGGVGVLAAYPAVGPYVGATARQALPGGAVGYGGLLVNHVRVVQSASLYLPTTWIQPVVGICSPPGRVRWGVEALAPIAAETGQAAGGVQAWVDIAVRSPD